MIERYFNAVVKLSKLRKKYFDDPMHYARLIKEVTGGKVIIFGSVVEGKHTMASDIDVLVILDSIENRNKVLMEINEILGEFHPFQIHLITENEFEWYRKFVKKGIEV